MSVDTPFKVPDRIPYGLGKESYSGKPYQVVLWNDDHNSVDHVVTTLIRAIDRLDMAAAVQIMHTAHTKGTAIVVQAVQEQAEHYRQQLEHGGLTATVEPVT